MHTESEARKLWCPMVRFTPIINSGIIIPGDRKRTEDGKIDDSCIASSCMMWQWVDDEFEYLFSPPENDEWTHAPYLSGEGRKCDRWQREKRTAVDSVDCQGRSTFQQEIAEEVSHENLRLPYQL